MTKLAGPGMVEGMRGVGGVGGSDSQVLGCFDGSGTLSWRNLTKRLGSCFGQLACKGDLVGENVPRVLGLVKQQGFLSYESLAKWVESVECPS